MKLKMTREEGTNLLAAITETCERHASIMDHWLVDKLTPIGDRLFKAIADDVAEQEIEYERVEKGGE